MTQSLRLRFADEAQAIVVLTTWFRHAPFTDDDGNEVPAGWIRDGLKHTFVPLGALVQTDAVMSDDGATVITPPVYFDGWHCDIKFRPGHPAEATIRAATAEYVVTPGNPKHDFS